MAAVLNDWIGYLDRSYQQIKTSLINKVTVSNPELTDHSEGNIFIIIISMFSGVAEMIGYYIDNIARESFIATAQRRSSIINLSTLIDYRINARTPESVDVLLIWTNNAGTPTPTPSAFTLGAGSSVESPDNKVYITLSDNTIAMGVNTSLIAFSEAVLIVAQDLGTTDGSQNQEVTIGLTYVDGSMSTTINSQIYTEVDTFANSGPNDFHYQINIKDDENAYMKFGDGVKGIIPPTGQSILADYTTTTGPDGAVAANTLTQNPTMLGTPADTLATSNNTLNSSGGSYFETNDEIRVNAVQSIRTLNRCVTWEDHEAVSVAVAGVAESLVNYNCGKKIDIYIAPVGGGIASSGLIAIVQAEMDLKKMVTSFITVKAAGETPLLIGVLVTAKIRKDVSATKTQVEGALLNYGDISNQKINNQVRTSDIISLIDNLSNVESLVLQSLSTLPYARPVNHNTVLAWTNETETTSSVLVNWTVSYTGTDFQVFKENLYLANVAIGVEFVDPVGDFKFTINAGGYSNGETWEFDVYPHTSDIDLKDFTVPTVNISDLIVTVIPSSINNRN